MTSLRRKLKGYLPTVESVDSRHDERLRQLVNDQRKNGIRVRKYAKATMVKLAGLRFMLVNKAQIDLTWQGLDDMHKVYLCSMLLATFAFLYILSDRFEGVMVSIVFQEGSNFQFMLKTKVLVLSLLLELNIYINPVTVS